MKPAAALLPLLAVVTTGCLGHDATTRAAGPSLFGPGGTVELEALRAGRAGIELPGITVARFDAEGHVDALASGCARFAPDGRICSAPLTPDSVMRVASISKLVTAIAAMKLVQEGRLELDRDVSDYLGFQLRNPAFPDTPLTLRLLMSHRSTLRDGEIYWAPSPQTLADLVQGPEHFDATHPPGGYFTYSNLGFGIVGAIVECAAAERFDRYMHRTLFAPLGVAAGYNWSGLESLAPERVTTLYRKQDGEEGPWDPQGPWLAQVDDFGGRAPAPAVRVADGTGPPPDDYRVCTNGTLFSPHGGLRISVRDLARVVAAALKDGTLERLSRPEWRLAAAGDNGDSLNGLYHGFGLGAQLDMAGTGLAGHFADAYGLKGGVLVDLRSRRGWIYLITGTSQEPVLAQPPREGLDTSEAGAIDALLDSR